MATTSAGGGRRWVWGITISVVLFVVIFVGFAIWTFQTDVELVYDNYYEKDVVFEQQIRRVERTDALPAQPRFQYLPTTQTLTLDWPLEIRDHAPVGTVLLFRPSDLHQDRKFALALVGDSTQTLSVPNLSKGLWRVKLAWTAHDQEYYLEQRLVIP